MADVAGDEGAAGSHPAESYVRRWTGLLPAGEFPEYSRAERDADVWVHAVGLVLGGAGVATIFAYGIPEVPTPAGVALAIYGVALMLMLASSALYNLVLDPGRKEVLRRLDHSAIFVMIAGTYTPMMVAGNGGVIGLALLAFVWSVAVAGTALVFLRPRRSERLRLALYLVAGWSIVVALNPLFRAISPESGLLLLGGGALYTIGIVFHLWTALPFHNVVWHVLVLVAAACHWLAVVRVTVPEVA